MKMAIRPPLKVGFSDPVSFLKFDSSKGHYSNTQILGLFVTGARLF